jgi:hypothetical protein
MRHFRTFAFAAGLLAAPAAAAQNIGPAQDLLLYVHVAEIAQLNIVTNNATVNMVDVNTTVLGTTDVLQPPTGMGQITLTSNYCIGGITFDFATVTGLRVNPTRIYGAAIGDVTGDILGVQPFLRTATSSGLQSFGNLIGLAGSTTNAPLVLSGASNGFCNGVYDIFAGLVTRWDLTLAPGPLFAAPDTYVIEITAEIIP